jgi:hypothetical protein
MQMIAAWLRAQWFDSQLKNPRKNFSRQRDSREVRSIRQTPLRIAKLHSKLPPSVRRSTRATRRLLAIHKASSQLEPQRLRQNQRKNQALSVRLYSTPYIRPPVLQAQLFSSPLIERAFPSRKRGPWFAILTRVRSQLRQNGQRLLP